MTAARLTTRVLNDAGTLFEVLVLEPVSPRAVVLFAVGAGGDPNRHRSFLTSIAVQGCEVIAPSFARLASPTPDADELATRARRLQLAFDDVALPNLPAAGVGHSIGAAALLMLAGAEATTHAGERVEVSPERRLDKLALMAPAADFFAAPGALESVRASIVIWAGTRDEVTPPTTAQQLAGRLHGIAPVDVRIFANAGHFSFMNAPPPHATELLVDRGAFLDALSEDVASFIMGRAMQPTLAPARM